jgi:multidrug efflux pump subunit AcrA (membrane-fusion protein)
MASDRLAALAAVLALAAPAAAANVFVCTDPSGRTITADRPPAECAGVPIRELRPDGSVRRVIEPPLTAEQRKARADQARREYQEQEKKRTQARRDFALLETYATEAEIEAARQTALASRQALIERARQRIEDYARERKRLDNEAEFYANRKMPPKLERAFEVNESLTQSEHKMIADMQADMLRINERFDTELKRFRELVLAGARPQARSGEGVSRQQ